MKHSSATFQFALVPIAVLAAFASPASAQLTESNSRTINPPILGLPYTQTGSGDFDGDANVDLAYLRGEYLGVMIAPGVFEVTMNDIALANDFDVVSTHETARILTVSNAAGLQEWRMEKAFAAEPDPNPPTWLWHAQSQGELDWDGATIVRTWSVDPALTYVVALNSAGNGLLVMQRTETAGPLTWITEWTEESTMALIYDANAGAVLDIVPFNLNGTGTPEVAVMREHRFEIYRPFDAAQPVTLVGGSNGYTYTAATRVCHAARTHEWVGLILTQNLDGVTQKFMTFGYDGLRNILTIGSSLQVFALRGGRVDADEDDDLIVGLRSQVGVIKIPNTGAVGDVPKFVIANSVSLTATSGSAPNNEARPFIADLDGDGDGDFGFPIRTIDEMWIYHETSNISATWQPLLHSRIEDPNTEVAMDLVGAEDLNSIEFKVDVPSLPSNVPAGPKYLELTLYSMRYDASSPPNYVEAAAFSTERILLSSTLPTQFTRDRDVPGDQSNVTGAPGFQRIVYITAQCIVAADATSNPTWAGPAMMAIVQCQDVPVGFDVAPTDNGNRGYVDFHVDTDLGTPFEVQDLSIHNDPGLPPIGTSVGNGGYVPCIPVRPERPPRH